MTSLSGVPPRRDPDKRPPVRRKLRHTIRWIRNLCVGVVAPIAIRLWMSTLRMRWSGAGIQRSEDNLKGRIYVLWHEKLLVFVHSHRNIGARMLVSAHGDGEMLARIGARLGFEPVRGSTTRGGMKAIRELLRDTEKGFDYGFTPDGPRGPRRKFQAGAIYFASRSGLPIVPTTVSYSRFWQLRTWDRFVLPKFFARGLARFGEEVHVPPGLDAEGLETWCRRLESILEEVSSDTETRFEELYQEGIPQKRGQKIQNSRSSMVAPPVSEGARRSVTLQAEEPVKASPRA